MSGVKVLNWAHKVVPKRKAGTHGEKNENPAEMAEAEGIQQMVNQAAEQAATAAMMVLRDTEAGCQLEPTVRPKSHRGIAVWT